MTKKVQVTEIILMAGIAAFAYWRYTKMTENEKDKIHADIKDIGEKVIKELLPEGIKSLLPSLTK